MVSMYGRTIRRQHIYERGMVMEGQEKKQAQAFDLNVLSATLDKIEQREDPEDTSTPRAIVISAYPRIKEVMTRKGYSVSMMYKVLAEELDLPISERTFASYLQVARKVHEASTKPGKGRGRKKADTVDHNQTVEAPASGEVQETPATIDNDRNETATGAHEAQEKVEAPESQDAQIAAPEPQDAKARFSAHESSLHQGMSDLAARLGAKQG